MRRVMKISHPQQLVPAGIYQLKVNIKNTRARCEIVYFEHISHLVLVFLLLTLNM